MRSRAPAWPVAARCLWLCVLALCACTHSLDSDLWDCQFSVQQGNAGHSEADNAERAQSIGACMAERGYRLDPNKPACVVGAVTPQCYRR